MDEANREQPAAAETTLAEQLVDLLAPWTDRLVSSRPTRLLQDTLGTAQSPNRKWVRVVVGADSDDKQQTTGALFGGGSDDDSDTECEYFDLDEPKPTQQIATSRQDTNRLVVEWLLLIEALAFGGADYIDMALARPIVREDCKGTKRRALGKGCEELGKTSLGLKLEGGVSELCDVLRELAGDKSMLSQDFQRACTSIHQALNDGATKPPIPIALRLVVTNASAETPRGTARLDALAVALRSFTQWLYESCQSGSRQIVLDAVDVPVTNHKTLHWLASSFPSDIRLGEVVWTGDSASFDDLQTAIRHLLHGNATKKTVPTIETLKPRCCDTNVLVAFLEATRSSQSLRSIELCEVLQAYGRDPEERAKRWRWFAYSLFGKRATHQLRHVAVNEWALLPEDVSAAEQILTSVVPERLLALPASWDVDTIETLKISSLDLRFGGVQHPTSAPLTQLIRSLSTRIHRPTRLSLSVSDDPAISDDCGATIVDSFGSTLQELSLFNVELDSLGSLFTSPSGSFLSLRSLQLRKLFVGDTETYKPVLVDLLGDTRNAAAKHLETIILHVSGRHSVEDVRQIVSHVNQMLERNKRITRCEVGLERDYGIAQKLFATELDAIDGEEVTSPVRLSSRLALLSVFECCERAYKHSRPARPRLSAPHTDSFSLIFEFAATKVKRTARFRTKPVSASPLTRFSFET